MKDFIKNHAKDIFIVLVLVGLGYFVAQKLHPKNETDRLHEELIGTKEKYEQLTKYTAKLESDYKSQAELAQKADRVWKEVVRKKEEQIKLLSDATFLIGRHSSKQDGPDYYFQTPKATRNYVYNEIRVAGPDSPPVGFVMIKNDGRTYKGNYAFEIQVETLQTVDESTGKIKVYTKAFLVAKENGLAEKRREDFKKWKGEQYPLEIVGGTATIDPTVARRDPPKFHLWAPHINGGFNAGVGLGGFFLKPELSFSVAGYGRSRNDLSWKFGHIGASVDTNFKNPDLHIMPFTYRPFPSILTNTYFGPGVGLGFEGWNYFLNTSVSF